VQIGKLHSDVTFCASFSPLSFHHLPLSPPPSLLPLPLSSLSLRHHGRRTQWMLICSKPPALSHLSSLKPSHSLPKKRSTCKDGKYSGSTCVSTCVSTHKKYSFLFISTQFNPLLYAQYRAQHTVATRTSARTARTISST
jgi:hypothetical protein